MGRYDGEDYDEDYWRERGKRTAPTTGEDRCRDCGEPTITERNIRIVYHASTGLVPCGQPETTTPPNASTTADGS